ncbi:MAG: hypothetical protein GY953_01745 [bacterium]|nr:hypothetical protein [bacterium]
MSANNTNHRGQTGPRTPEGKARSSQNALKHGLTAAHLSIPDAERDEFEGFRTALWDEVRPAGALQINAFNHLLHAAWNIHRIQRLEGSLFAEHTNPFSDETAARQLDRLARYLAMHHRAYNQSLKKLEQFQTNAFTRGTLPEVAAEHIRPLVSVKEAFNAKRNQRQYWPNDFDAALDDLEAAFQADIRETNGEYEEAAAA